jgi:hypothetical protein
MIVILINKYNVMMLLNFKRTLFRDVCVREIERMLSA